MKVDPIEIFDCNIRSYRPVIKIEPKVFANKRKEIRDICDSVSVDKW